MQAAATITIENFQLVQWYIGLAIQFLAPVLPAVINAWYQIGQNREMRRQADERFWLLREDVNDILRWRSEVEGRRDWEMHAARFGPLKNGERGGGCNVTPSPNEHRPGRRKKR